MSSSDLIELLRLLALVKSGRLLARPNDDGEDAGQQPRDRADDKARNWVGEELRTDDGANRLAGRCAAAIECGERAALVKRDAVGKHGNSRGKHAVEANLQHAPGGDDHGKCGRDRSAPESTAADKTAEKDKRRALAKAAVAVVGKRAENEI